MVEISEPWYFTFMLFKLDSKWRWMADLAKTESAYEVKNVLENSKTLYRTYSTLGIRDDGDFMIWFADKSVEKIQDTVSKLYHTIFGKYIEPSKTFFSSTRDSKYVESKLPPAFIAGQQQHKYTIVYPFTKTRTWYLLGSQERQNMMDEHIQVGKKYPNILLNTTYSFGIHDQDFMLAFETNDLIEFQSLIMELRETKVSEYIKIDTPMIVGVKNDIFSIITSMG